MADARIGKCAWCGKHNQRLFFLTWVYDGRILSDWVCEKCLDEYRQEELRRFMVSGEQTEPAE